MIRVYDPALFRDALDCLNVHRKAVGRVFKGRFIQIFLGLKFFQNNLPSLYSGSFIETQVLQSLLDDLYAKGSRQPNNCVLSLFTAKFLARTGLVDHGNTDAQNTWRNNFNLQKGVGCYAPPADLASQTFLDQERIECRYLHAPRLGTLRGSRCSLCPSGASYRGEGHRKWLRIDPGGNGYAVTDLQNTRNFTPYVAPAGRRIPILPLIVALYHDADPGLVLGTRKEVGLGEFMADFNLSPSEFSAYFDDSPSHSLNQRLRGSRRWPRNASLGRPLVIPPAALPQNAESSVRRSRARQIPSEPLLTGTPVPPPAANSGWEAEQFVMAALTNEGWKTYLVSRQQLGYDIFCQKGSKKRYVEVKSSLGLCSPSLTNREWQQAKFHAGSYVLAIVENFSPSGQNMVYWIPDPSARCISIPQMTVSHSIPRGSWANSAVSIDLL